MNCQELLTAINAQLDGETRTALCRELREHLAGCEACRVVIDNLRQTITVYRAGEELPLPAGVHGRLLTILQERWSQRTPPLAQRIETTCCEPDPSKGIEP